MAVDEYNVRVKDLEKKFGEKKLKEMALPPGLRSSDQDVERSESEKKLLQLRKEESLDLSAREAGTCSRYVEQP